MGKTKAAHGAIVVRTGVKPILHHGGLDGCGLVDGLQGGEVGVGDSEAADWVRHVLFQGVPCREGLGGAGEGGVED